MGIIDFVKKGVDRLTIARPDADKHKVVFKHPDQTFPFWSQCTVDSDEVCLFFKDGKYIGALGPGRHTLQTQNIPFLGDLVDRMTGGDLFISELYFVTTRPFFNEGFGGPIGGVRDPNPKAPPVRVNPRAFGTYSFRVSDPLKFVVEYAGQTGVVDHEHALQWVRDKLLMSLVGSLEELLRKGDTSLMDLGFAGPKVSKLITGGAAPELVKCGIQVLEIGKLNINLPPEEEERLNKFQDQILQAYTEARAAEQKIGQAQAEAQQRQYQLDQDFANRQRYVNQMDVQRYQQYAGAEAMMGMGQGMAHGGQGPQAGMVGAGMVAGMGMGMGMGMPYGYPPPGYPPPGYPPQGYPPPGYPPQGYPPGYPPPGMAGAPGAPGMPPPGAPGAPMAASGPAPGTPGAPTPPTVQGVACPKCSSPNPSGSKFCAECGTRIV